MPVKIAFMSNGLRLNLFFFMIFLECSPEQANNVVDQSFPLHVIYGSSPLGTKPDTHV